MLKKEQGGSAMVVMNPLFRPETFDLLAGEFATNLSFYRNYANDDAVAGLFLGCALDIIDCTYYTFAKSLPGEKERIVESLIDGCREEIFGTHLLEDILEPGLAREVVEQHNMLLEALREKYQWLVRGPLDICWRESTDSIEEKSDVCRSRAACRAGEGDTSALHKRCDSYYSSWRGTMLAMDGCEDLREDPAALAREIRGRCRVLGLLTNPVGLTDYLELRYGNNSPDEEMRTVRGVMARLLTMLIDESLADLSRRMNLPPGEELYFTPPLN